MKKIFFILSTMCLMFGFTACETDNFDAPSATIQGQIKDQNGNPLQTEQGSGNTRIKMEELSWANGDPEVAIIPTYLNMHQDGSYINNKIFNGEYRMTPIDGPFYPYDTAGEVVQIKGTVTKDFTVTPYLDVTWVSEPSVTADNKITCSVTFKRNEKAGEKIPDLSNAKLFIATTQYVGNNNKDDQVNGGTVNVANNQEGTTLTFTSNTVKYTGTTYYVRVGVCCNIGDKKYNYTTIKTVTVN